MSFLYQVHLPFIFYIFFTEKTDYFSISLPPLPSPLFLSFSLPLSPFLSFHRPDPKPETVLPGLLRCRDLHYLTGYIIQFEVKSEIRGFSIGSPESWGYLRTKARLFGDPVSHHCRCFSRALSDSTRGMLQCSNTGDAAMFHTGDAAMFQDVSPGHIAIVFTGRCMQ